MDSFEGNHVSDCLFKALFLFYGQKTGNILQFLKTYFLNWMKFYIGHKKGI